MRRLLLLTLLSLVFAPTAVQAEMQSCDCFCGTEKGGAFSGAYNVSNSTCQYTCEAAGAEVVGCFTDRLQWPDKSELCWTKEQCLSRGTGAGEADGDCVAQEDGYMWCDKVPDCLDTPIPSGYCYQSPTSYTLIQPFGGNTAFSGLPQYVSAAYKFLVPVMAMVAVLMLMVSGVQYMLARGDANVIKKAKSHMASAITGLILLMSAWTVAYVVDPRLVNLRQLRVPEVKQVVVIDSSATCEYLSSVGFEIDDTSNEDIQKQNKKCLAEGAVTGVDDVAANVATGAWEEGDTCTFSYCEDGATCTEDGCQSCIDMQTGGYITPSPSTCSAFSSEEDPGAPSGGKYFCEYLDLTGDAWTGSTVTAASCTQVSLECTKLRSAPGGGSCRLYDSVGLQYGSQFSMELQKLQGADQELFRSICSADPCGFSSSGCVPFDENTGYDAGVAADCVGGNDDPTGSAGAGVTGGTCYSREQKKINCVTGALISS